MLKLASFLNDWWLAITKFIHEMNQTVRYLIVGALVICAMFSLIKVLKKEKFRTEEKYHIGFIILAIVLIGIAILLATI